MKNTIGVCIGFGGFVLAGLWLAQLSNADESSQSAGDAAPSITGAKLETLLATPLEGAEGIEVIVSRVTMPPDTALPKHWHPGEEFAYVLEGSAILWRDGEPDVVISSGEAVAIPLKQVHTAMTTEQGATMLVFRVHEQGKPERVLVD